MPVRRAPLVTVTIALALTAACAATPSHQTSPAPAPAATGSTSSAASSSASSPAPSASSSLSAGARLVRSPCVLHAGSRRVKGGRDAKARHTSCNFGAECIAIHGKATPGDGFVGASCEDAACQCEWSEPLSDTPLRESFTLDAIPTAADACQRLLVERCMRGMRLFEPGAAAE